jgi:branched-chain amino acid transport system substrate-binding protein
MWKVWAFPKPVKEEITMFLGKRSAAVLAIAMTITLVLSGCGPAATPTPKPVQPAATSVPATPVPPSQPKTIKIGVIYPLTGNLGATGQDTKSAVEFAAEIVNNKYDIDFPFAKTEGIPSLGGAKLELFFGDSRGDPTQAMAEAERLITQEKVVAMCGAYNSAVAKTVSVVTERYKIPYVVSDVTSPALTERGFQYFFRVIPHDGMQTKNALVCLDDINKKYNAGIKTIALIWENTEWGSNVGLIVRTNAEQYGFTVVADIGYSSKATDVTAEVARIKAAKPDAIIHASYITDAILFNKTLKAMDVQPKAWIGMGGYVEPDFIASVGKDADFILARATFAPDLLTTKPYDAKINEAYKAKLGHDISVSAAEGVDQIFVLADALNRAASTDSDKLQKALMDTNLPETAVFGAYAGVKFDPSTHDNLLGRNTYLQIMDGKYRLVWPFAIAATPYTPYPSWKNR